MFYGDDQTLRDCYEAIRHYVDYITGISPTGICSWGLGDWVPVKSRTPVPFTSTIYYYTDVSILSEAARLFNRQADYEKYSTLAAKIKKVFNETYLNTETGIYGQGYQTEMSAPLYWGIVPEQYARKVAAALNQRVAADGFKLDVGLLGSKTILDALSMYGYHNTAYKMAGSRVFPSWGWWIVNGATTLYENWNIDAKSDISLNHIMFGQIGAWMYRGLGGMLPDPSAPGFKHTILRPAFPDSLDSFQASHTTPFGVLALSWHRKGNKRRMAKNENNKSVLLHIEVPVGTSATFYVPAGYAPAVKSRRGLSGHIWAIQSDTNQLYYDLNYTELSGGNYNFVLEKIKEAE